MKREHYDFVVLGGGTGGKSLAIDLSNSGKKVALIEKEMIGGSCVNVACLPSKDLIENAKVCEIIATAASKGIEIGEYKINLKKIIERKNRIISEIRQSILEQIQNTPNLTFFLGVGHFIDECTIQVKQNDGKEIILSGNKVIINTGSRPLIPSIQGIEKITPFTSATILDIQELPQHLVIIGGGYIGLECAQMFKRFGSKVSLIQRREQLLPREDHDCALEIKQILEDEGISIYLNTNPLSIKKEGQEIEVQCHDNNDQMITIKGTHLLVATGREPNTEKLNLSATKVSCNVKGYILTNEYLKTTHPRIWALGDVNGGPQFTHISYDDFRIVKSQLLDTPLRDTINRVIPYTVFIDPELARIGLTEKEAFEKGLSFKIAKMPSSYIARNKLSGQTKGFLKVIVNDHTHEILGCTILCDKAGEMIGTLQVAMMAKVPYFKLRDTIFSHPCLIEGFNNLFANLEESSLKKLYATASNF